MSKRTSEEAGIAAVDDRVTKLPPLRLSHDYQDETADIELRSKDRIRFFVHKANLSSGSKIFADMFTIARADTEEGERPVIELVESSQILNKILPYFYPNRIEPWVFHYDEASDDWKTIAAFDKFEIWRGLDVIEAVFKNFIKQRGSGLCSYGGHWLFIYLYFCHFSAQDIDYYFRDQLLLLVLEEDINFRTLELEKSFEEIIESVPFLKSYANISKLTIWVLIRRIKTMELLDEAEHKMIQENDENLSPLIHSEWQSAKYLPTSARIQENLGRSEFFDQDSPIKEIFIKGVHKVVSKLRTLEHANPRP